MKLLLQRLPDGRVADRGMWDPGVLVALGMLLGCFVAAAIAGSAQLAVGRWARFGVIVGVALGVEVVALAVAGWLFQLGFAADAIGVGLAATRLAGAGAIAWVQWPIWIGHRALGGVERDAAGLLGPAFFLAVLAPGVVRQLQHPLFTLLLAIAP